MPDRVSGKFSSERRKYPRIKATCPLNYFTRTTGNWNEARLEDYSAGGLCFVCDETLQENSKITIQVTRDAHEEVPAMAASAVVVRCESNEDQRFKIACKFTRAKKETSPDVSRFRLGNR